MGADVHIAGGQLYDHSGTLSNSIQGRRIYGDGPKVSVLQPTGAIDTLVNSSPLNMVMMDNFGIYGDDTTLDGITQASGTSMTASVLQNIFVTVGGRAFYLFDEFNTQLINCNGSSFNNNVFELQGWQHNTAGRMLCIAEYRSAATATASTAAGNARLVHWHRHSGRWRLGIIQGRPRPKATR